MVNRTIRIVVAFDGTSYGGWQRQKNAATIQQKLEETIGVMTGEKIIVHGAGRTDAGVHALGMVASFSTAAAIPSAGFLRGLNSMLPGDIRILDLGDVDSGFHARYSAGSKTYFYQLDIASVQLPTDRLYTLHVACSLDLGKIRKCLVALTGEHDFSCFEAAGSRDRDDCKGRGAVRRLFEADLFQVDGRESILRLQFTGDGFLRHMVRNLVGSLLEVGCRKRSVDNFISLLDGGDRGDAGPTAPARGLFLKEVHYDQRNS